MAEENAKILWKDKPENKVKMKEYQKEWREKHKDKLMSQRKKYYENNKEKVLGYTRKWREKNPEKIKVYSEKTKERYKNDPEFRAKQQEAYKKWAEKRKGVEKSPTISCTDSDVAVAKDL
jgi:hypothetical protein